MGKAKWSVKPGEALVAAGTAKGLFLFASGPDRRKWRMGGPFLKGREVYSVAIDARGGSARVLAGASNFFGCAIVRSEDGGATWIEPEKGNIRFPEDTGATLTRVWQIQPAPASQPGVVWAGTEPAALFRSDDGGATWSLARGLWDHPHRPKWQPGGGGLCLHTILPHPTDAARMLIAISSGGAYRTEDGGRTWTARNRGVAARFLPDPNVEFGQCVHKVARHPSRPATLFQQHHGGVYRSDDEGDSWRPIHDGLPSDFGFPIAVDPNDPDRVYVVPLNADVFRAPPSARLRVWRSPNGGGAWEPLERGLPQRGMYASVLRDAFAVDARAPTGLYLGTRNGQLFASSDAGESWTTLAKYLPPVLSVRAAAV